MADRRRRRALEDEGEETTAEKDTEVKGRPSECVSLFICSSSLYSHFASFCWLGNWFRDNFENFSQIPTWEALGLHYNYENFTMLGSLLVPWTYELLIIMVSFVNIQGKIQGDGRKFLDRFKSYFGSQISQSLNEVHIYRLQSKSTIKDDLFFFIYIFVFDHGVMDCKWQTKPTKCR